MTIQKSQQYSVKNIPEIQRGGSTVATSATACFYDSESDLRNTFNLSSQQTKARLPPSLMTSFIGFSTWALLWPATMPSMVLRGEEDI